MRALPPPRTTLDEAPEPEPAKSEPQDQDGDGHDFPWNPGAGGLPDDGHDFPWPSAGDPFE